MIRSNLLLAILIVAASVLTSRSATPQTNTGELQGIVKDPSGAVLPGATVTAFHLSSGFSSERRTDDRGRFFIPALPVGEYSVRVALEGFKAVTQSGLLLQVGQRLEVPIVLPIGLQSESVTVTAIAPLLQISNAEI